MGRKQIKDFHRELEREFARLRAAPISAGDKRRIEAFAKEMLGKGNKPSYIYSELISLGPG